MEERQARTAFAALSQETRLRIVRLLVQAGPDGMAAGAIAEAVAVSPSNVSFHLKDLEHAGMIVPRREARSIIYSAAGQINGTVTVGHTGICPSGCGANINGSLFGSGAQQVGITYNISPGTGLSIFGVAAFGKQ